MTKRKICVVTGTRAEYGLLYWLVKEIESDSDLELQIIATGMHLSPEFGLTYKEIEKEFTCSKKIEMLLSSDTPIGISKSMGLAQISFAEAYEELRPDVVVVLGDRYEIFSAATAAMIARIPIAHLHGGETTEGAFDEPIRHSITKMSHLHFVATEEYRNRVIQLGEHPSRVFNVGGMGVENIKRLNLLTYKEFEKSIDFKLGIKNILVTFHPVTLENSTAKDQFQELLDAIDELQDTNIIFTKANSDTDGRTINQMIDEYVAKNSDKSVGFTSLGQLRYLSALQFVDAVVGNSSSGLLEAPSFKIGTINIGDRQKGRIRAASVIDCVPDKKSIKNAFEKLYSAEFQELLKTVQNPYGDGCASKKIIKEIKKVDHGSILKKSFYDLKGNPIPIYGDGKNIRDWLYVLDHCKGIDLVYHKGKKGETYNIGGRNERTNLQIVNTICEILDKKVPLSSSPVIASEARQSITSYKDLITFVEDRAGHDRRYAIDATKLETQLGWKADENFDTGIIKTVDWYLNKYKVNK